MHLEAQLFFSLAFGLIGAVMASLIVFTEYNKHRLNKRRVWREALAGGAFAFVILVVLSLVAVYCVARLLS